MAPKTETRNVSGFSEVSLRGFGEANLILGDTEGLVVEADEAIISRIRSEVRGDKLVLGFDLAWWEWLTYWWTMLTIPHKRVRYTIQMCNFSGASISGSGKVVASELHGGACRFSISGSGAVAIDRLEANSVDTRISGAGHVKMAGHADRQDLHISGSGHVENQDLVTDATDIHISGSGKASVNATKTLGVNISGSGSVFYRGQPQVSQRISGSGRVAAS